MSKTGIVIFYWFTADLASRRQTFDIP